MSSEVQVQGVQDPRPSFMVQRAEWGGPPIKSMETSTPPLRHVVFMSTGGRLCHTRTECCTATKELYYSHTSAGAPDLMFNFMVGGDGAVYKGRGFYQKPSLPKNLSYFADNALNIGFFGDFQVEEPPYHMVAAAIDIIKMGMRMSFIPPSYKLISLLRGQPLEVE